MKNKQKKTKANTFTILTRLLSLVTPLWAHMGLAIFFGTLGHLCAIAIPVLGGVALLSALGFFSLSLPMLFMVMVGAGVLRGVNAYIEQNRNHYIAFRLLALIRDKVFSALRRLCPAKLEGKNRGNLITLLTADIELLEVFYAHTLSPVAIALLVGGCMTAIMAHFHACFGIIAFVAYLVTGVFLPIKMGKKAKKLFTLQRAGAGNFSSYYMDSLRGIGDIVQLNAGEERKTGIVQKTEELATMTEEIAKEEGKINGFSDALVLGFSGAVLLCGASLGLSFPSILLPTLLMFSSFGAVLSLARLSTGLSRVLAAGERVLGLLDEEPEVMEVQEGETPPFDDVTVQDLTFGYDETIILKNENFHFEKGKTYGIHGKSGSGKSTLLKLLMRFWSVPRFAITFGKTDISAIKTAHLRNMESYMTQETELFHTSIAENIKVGKLDATMDEVICASKKASFHGFVMSLPKGYDTNIGELGSELSGGERQRLGLARAFLHDAPFLLLDEPTSNLDSLNEAVILKAIGEDKERTSVLVSHRLSTLSICDEKMYVKEKEL